MIEFFSAYLKTVQPQTKKKKKRAHTHTHTEILCIKQTMQNTCAHIPATMGKMHFFFFVRTMADILETKSK